MDIEVQVGEDILIVDLSYDVVKENDGIGSYEYWGYTYYDRGNDYFIVENMKWDKTLYTDQENEIIERYVEKYAEEIETKILSNHDSDHYEYD